MYYHGCSIGCVITDVGIIGRVITGVIILRTSYFVGTTTYEVGTRRCIVRCVITNVINMCWMCYHRRYNRYWCAIILCTSYEVGTRCRTCNYTCGMCNFFLKGDKSMMWEKHRTTSRYLR